MSGRPVIAVTGPPGAGKSTALLALAAADPRIVRFGVRDHAFALAASGNALGIELRSAIVRNRITLTQVIGQFGYFLDHLPRYAELVVTDGYPRSGTECVGWYAEVSARDLDPAGLVAVEVPERVAAARARARRICPECGLPAGHHGCRGVPAGRQDDTPDRIASRLAAYRDGGAEVRAFFTGRCPVTVVDGSAPPDVVRDHLGRLLAAHLPAAHLPARTRGSMPS
jgi:adenylate kinase